MNKLAIITTHPIQYYAPMFRMLAQHAGLSIKVFYTWPQSQQEKFDPGFGRTIQWDVPLLDGYPYTFVPNTALRPGSHGFWGIKNPSLNREITKWSPDALLLFSWSYWSNLAALHYFKGKIPVYFRGDSHLLDEVAGVKVFLRRKWLTWVYAHIDYAFYVGENNRQYFLRHGLASKQLLFAPHAVANQQFTKNQAELEAKALVWRRQLRIPDTGTVFVFAAKLEPKKDPALLLKAFRALNLSSTYLVVVGNGPLEQVLKNEYGTHPCIRFLDFQNQSKMPVVYRLGDVFVLPSQGPAETWGLSVNEAMACGRAVLVSNKVGCAADLVKPGYNGYVFEAGNLNSLSDALLRIVAEKERLPLMGAASSSIVENWSVERLVANIAHGVLQPHSRAITVQEKQTFS